MHQVLPTRESIRLGLMVLYLCHLALGEIICPVSMISYKIKYIGISEVLNDILGIVAFVSRMNDLLNYSHNSLYSSKYSNPFIF